MGGLALFILFSFFIPLGMVPLFDLDEGAFSEATREMLVGGDYITTYLNGELRFDKPILIYWLQLLSVKLFGLNEFALRLPSAIAASFWAFAIYYFTKIYIDKLGAFFAALFMVTALQTTIIAKAAIADALLNLFITISLFLIYQFYINRKLRDLYLAFLFIGLGALTKGPVAIMIPFVVSFLFFAIKKETLLWAKSIFNLKGLLIFAVVALPWYIAQYIAQGQLFIDGFFLKHNLSRFSDAMELHSGGYYYYFIVLAIGLMPFTGFFIKTLFKVKSFLSNDLYLFLSIWFVFVFVFFTLSGTKLPHYVIYGYTPIFILSALAMKENFSKVWLLAPLFLFTLIFLFFPEIITALQPQIKDKFVVVLIDHVYENFDILYRVTLILLILFIIFLMVKKLSNISVILGASLSMIVLVNYAVFPAYAKLMQSPVKEAALLAKERGYKVVMDVNQMPSFNVYYEGLVSKEKPKIGDVVFTKVTSLKKFDNYETLYRKNGFSLIRIKE